MSSKSHNPTISIAMCLCNPSKDYLLQQLTSIEEQSLLPNEIIVCDDSENEAGLDIVSDWSKKSGIHCNTFYNASPLGIVGNFSSAIQKTSGDYVFLCDQDDIWKPEKIQQSVLEIQTHEQGGDIPTLYHTDLELVDQSGRSTGRSFMKVQRIQGGTKNPIGLLMLHNVVTGCAAAMNRSLVNLATPIPEHAVVHDWWIALVAAAKGQIIFESNPLIQYRLHGSNSIGVRPFISKTNARRIFTPSHIGREFAKVVHQNLAFYEKFGNSLSPSMKEFVEFLPIGGLPLLRAAKKAGVKPQSWPRTVRFKLAALGKVYKKYVAPLSNISI